MPDLEATGALPPDDAPSDLQAELEAEFADHLALVARDEMLRGRSADEATVKANERFGDVTQIERQCRWVHQGDAVMLRTVMIGGLAILAIALGVTTWTSWQAQSRQARRIDELSAKLEAIEETKPAPTMGMISGVAYLGEKSKPAVGVEVQLLRAPAQEISSDRRASPNWVIERSILTDSEGKYQFEALAPSSYSVFANLVESREDVLSAVSLACIQSKPMPIAPGSDIEAPLDVEFQGGHVRMGLSRPLPSPLEHDGHQLTFTLKGYLWQVPDPQRSELRLPLPTRTWDAAQRSWPLKGYQREVLSHYRYLLQFFLDESSKFSSGEPRRLAFRDRHRGTPKYAVAGVEPAGKPSSSSAEAVGFQLLDPQYAAKEDARPWMSGKYFVYVQIGLIDETGELITFPFPHNAHNSVTRPHTGFHEFEVGDEKTTDLQVLIPEEMNDWAKSLQDDLEQVIGDGGEGRGGGRSLTRLLDSPPLTAEEAEEQLQQRVANREERVQSAKERYEQYQRIVDILDHVFEIEVTGPRPAE